MDPTSSAECRTEATSQYSPELIDAMFAHDDVLSFDPVEQKEPVEGHHVLSIFETIAKGSPSTATSSADTSGLIARMGDVSVSALLSDTVLLAVPASLLEAGLSAEQIVEGIAKMRLIARQLSPENLNTFKTACFPPESLTSGNNEDADSVRFPLFENGRCTHKKCWKRLRAKRGYAYFICLQCGLKWRSTSLSEKLKKQKQGSTTEE